METRFISAFNLLEIWAVFWLIVLLILSSKINWLLIPTLACLSEKLYFMIILILTLIITLFTTTGNKSSALFSLLKVGLESNLKINFHGVKSEEFKDCIILANYPSNFLEYILIPMYLPRESAIVISNVGYHWAKLFVDSSNLIQLNKKNNFESLKETLNQSLKNNILPVVFPEKNFWKRSSINEIQEFKSGIFKIAQQLEKRILLVSVEHITHFCGFITSKELNLTFEWCKSFDPVEAQEQLQQMINSNETKNQKVE
jgi:hypothetical protein